MQGGNSNCAVALPEATPSPFGTASLLGEQMGFAPAQQNKPSIFIKLTYLSSSIKNGTAFCIFWFVVYL